MLLGYDVTLIIMSAGESSRFRKASGMKKHWVRVDNRPMWLYVADELSNRYSFRDVIVVGSKRDVLYMRRFCNYKIVEGGTTRQDSLSNALKHVDSEFVAVSDAARCSFDNCVLDNLFNYDLELVDCLVPVIGINDTVFVSSNNNKTYVDRNNVFRVQTPQISRVSTLLDAIKVGEFTDESSAINAYGGRVETINGSKIMDKITYFQDLDSLDISSSNDVFVGYGFDVHKFCEGREIFLGGVSIPCDVGVEAHSDGDVVIHSLCDALLGAIGAGDIGEWFPVDDDKYDDIDSKFLLQEVIDFVYSVGFRIVNVDIMIMSQKPKILPFKNQMLDVISGILDIPSNFINIKATTMENMGFIGRQEGVCSSSNVSLKLLY